MQQKRRENEAHTKQSVLVSEPCTCSPPSLQSIPAGQRENSADHDQMVLIPTNLHNRLRAVLDSLFPRSQPLSVLLLHVSQWEQTHIPAQGLSYERQRYHAPPGLLEQILANVRRVIRIDDQLLIHEDVGAALVLPNVDQHGAYSILERVYHSIGLLQAETVIPPLTRETAITLGIGTYPDPGETTEKLLYHTGVVARCFTLRPAITAELLAIKPVPAQKHTQRQQSHWKQQKRHNNASLAVPFLELPQLLPKRLTHLLPYRLALELRCAPVGRNHHYLTVAMLDPLDTEAVHRLCAVTGMAIFPVSCKKEDLNALLENGW